MGPQAGAPDPAPAVPLRVCVCELLLAVTLLDLLLLETDPEKQFSLQEVHNAVLTKTALAREEKAAALSRGRGCTVRHL